MFRKWLKTEVGLFMIESLLLHKFLYIQETLKDFDFTNIMEHINMFQDSG